MTRRGQAYQAMLGASPAKKKKSRSLELSITVDHRTMPVINPGVVANVIAEQGAKGVSSQTRKGYGGDEVMLGYGEDAIRAREKLGLRTDVVDLRRTGAMMESLGKTSQKVKGGRKEGGEFVTWDEVQIGVGVGAKRGSDKNEQKKKAIIIQNWANFHLGKFSREMFRTAKATQQAIAESIENSAQLIDKARLQRKVRAAQRKAARDARKAAQG